MDVESPLLSKYKETKTKKMERRRRRVVLEGKSFELFIIAAV